MRIMPFTSDVYNHLLNGGYTHVIYSHIDFQNHNGEKRSVILEVVNTDGPAKPNMMSLRGDVVKSFLTNTNTRYYIRNSNIANVEASYKMSYTKAEATELQQKYRYLVNKPFTIQGDELGKIDCVSIAPFDEINKWIFFQFYTSTKDCTKAMSHYYVPYYDVLVIGTISGSDEYMFESLSTYLSANNIKADYQLVSVRNTTTTQA